MRNRILSFLLVACTVFVAGAGDVNNRPTWPSTVYGSMIVDDIQPLVIEDGLVGRWLFQDGSGTNAVDISGNGHDGTLLNSATWSSYSPFAAGTGSFYAQPTNKYASVPNHADLRPGGSMTIMTWMRPENRPTANGRNIMGKIGASGNRDYLLQFVKVNESLTTIYFYIAEDASTLIYRVSDTDIPDDTWSHIVGVYDASAQTLAIYVDGSVTGGTTYGTVPSSQYHNSSALGFGNRPSDYLDSYALDGYLYDARIYERALTVNEIASIAAGH